MKVKTVSYSQLKNTGSFENQRAEVTIEVNENESVDKAFQKAKILVKRALELTPSKSEIEKARSVLLQADGVEDIDI